jgi:type II secretory ATPase GspE/PulE/Tfp pilus assembly ATPase PilB-like protein
VRCLPPDLDAALGRIEDEADLDVAFATMKRYRANAIPLTQETAAATVGACLRSGRADMGAHVLNFHRQLRVWPSGEEYAAVITALLEDGEGGAGRAAEALRLLDGAAQYRIAVPQTAVDAVVQAAAVTAGKREAAARQAAAAAADSEAAPDDGEGEEGGEDQPEAAAEDDAEAAEDEEEKGIPLRMLEKVLAAAAETGASHPHVAGGDRFCP